MSVAGASRPGAPDRRRAAPARRRRRTRHTCPPRRCSATPPTSRGCRTATSRCVWFGGTQEGVSDITAYLSRMPAGADTWLAARAAQRRPDAVGAEPGPLHGPGRRRLAALHGSARRQPGHVRGAATGLARRWRHVGAADGAAPRDRGRWRLRAPAARGDRWRPHPAARLQLRHRARREVGRQRGHVERVVERRRRRLVDRGAGARVARLRAHERRCTTGRFALGLLPEPLGRPHLGDDVDRRRPDVGRADPDRAAQQQLLDPGRRHGGRPGRAGLQPAARRSTPPNAGCPSTTRSTTRASSTVSTVRSSRSRRPRRPRQRVDGRRSGVHRGRP